MWNIVQSWNPTCQWTCCGAVWLIFISLGSSPPEAYCVLCAVLTNCTKWTHTIEIVSAVCLSSHFICVTEQNTIKFSIYVYCKGCRANFIVHLVNQDWPLLHTKPDFKLNDVEIWGSLFMTMGIHIVVFCVMRSRVAKHADVNPKKAHPFVYVNMERPYNSSSPVHVSSPKIVTTPYCLKLRLFLFACRSYGIWTLCLDEPKFPFSYFEWVLNLE